jgi:hypothetical protein
MGKDIAQHRLGQLVEAGRVLGQRHVEQPLAQGVGERLPDRFRRQRGEVIGHAVD